MSLWQIYNFKEVEPVMTPIINYFTSFFQLLLQAFRQKKGETN